MQNKLMQVWFGVVLAGAAMAVAAPEMQLSSHLSGAQFEHDVTSGESLGSLAARYGVGGRLIASGNGLDKAASLQRGARLSIDNRHIVPAAVDEGIVVNIPQRMLFLVHEGQPELAFPVGLGRSDWHTPTGAFAVHDMQPDKTWIVPPSIQAEMQRQGKPTVTEVPPGPDNPLGRYWIGLSLRNIGIHGTIAPLSVYRFASHGCIRLHPQDIQALYSAVSPGTPGRIVYEPVLLAKLPDGSIYLEVNPDIYGRQPDALAAARLLAERAGISNAIDWKQAAEVAGQREGIARQVGSIPISRPQRPARAMTAIALRD